MTLNFGNKVENNGSNADGKLSAEEFNLLVQQVNNNEKAVEDLSKVVDPLLESNKSSNPITGMDVSWAGVQDAKIEEFIKSQLNSKGGYMVRSDKREDDGYYHLRMFANQSSYQLWVADKTANAKYILGDVTLPDTSSQTKSYAVKLINGSDKNITTTTGKVVLKLRFTSQVKDLVDGTLTDTEEQGLITVETMMSNSSVWETKGTVNISSVPATSTAFTDVDISKFMSNGTQNVRIIVKGATYEALSTYVSYTITLTDLSVSYGGSWEQPYTGTTFMLPFYVKGNIAKDLNVTISGKNYEKTYTISLGTTIYTETPYSLSVEHPNAHGIFTVRAWLTSGGIISTTPITTQIMCILDGNTTPLLVINNASQKLINWSTSKLFDYAIYNPSSTTTDVSFVLWNDALTVSYLTMNSLGIKNSDKQSYSAMLEVDLGDNPVASFNARMTFKSGDNTNLREQMLFIVDNSENYSPTAGADFVFNPKLRNNTETTPETIVNTASGAIVNSTWYGFGGITDRWIEDSDQVRCLRVLAGERVTIDYESFSDTTGKDGLTIELDIASRNATNVDEAILQMCSTYTDGLPLGLVIYPQSAYFYTSNNRDSESQDVLFQEGERTHIVTNIIYNLASSGLNYVRIFINGCINREFLYGKDESFWQYENGVKTSNGIRIGSSSSDIDIYSIRIYKMAISASNIRQDFMASMPSIDQKKAYKEANSILDSNGHIDYALSRVKYNTMLFTGIRPDYYNRATADKGYGDLEIHKPGFPQYSGTINNVSIKGQGSSSKEYQKWNAQYGFTKAKVDSVTGKTTIAGKGTVSAWIDENGVNHGAKYQLNESSPAAKKLVDKLNYASSMQSHKAGATALFTDIWREVVGGNSITSTDGYSNVRVSVIEEPFLLFTRNTVDEDPVFYGMVTFGPGKADEPTFVGSLSKFPEYLLIEGSDNTPPLTLHQVPWNEDVIDVIEDGVLAGWGYDNNVSFDYDLGKSANISYFKNAFNFVYLCSNRLKPFIGTLESMKTSITSNDTYMHWVTEGSTSAAQYDVFRWDFLTSSWVAAGVNKISSGVYETLNLRTQLLSLMPGFDTSASVQNKVWNDINTLFINARISMFANGCGDYFNLSDTRYNMMFTKLLGASDNRAKNTYLYLDPITLKICYANDDLDTIFLTDNSGKKDKPYYVEEHDLNTKKGANYWNGEPNTLYNLMELAFPVELRSTMKSILTSMAKRSGLSNEASTLECLMACFQKYFFWIQEYFPTVAYNEVARLLYEQGQYNMDVLGNYSYNVRPITQSLGDQLQGEKSWLNLRCTYISSFCSYGEFDLSSNTAVAFRSVNALNGSSTSQFTFNLTPFMWLYPAMRLGQSYMYGNGDKQYPERVQAGVTKTFTFSSDNNTIISYFGPDYMKSIGDWHDKNIGESGASFILSGVRLTTFKAGDATDSISFRYNGLSINAKNLKELNLSRISTLIGKLSLGLEKDANSKVTHTPNDRLVTINVTGTSFTEIALPPSQALKNLYLPATLTKLDITSQPNLVNTSIEGVNSLQTVIVDQNKAGAFDTKALATNLMNATGNKLVSLQLLNINWTNVSKGLITQLSNKSGLTITGQITLSSTDYLTLSEKQILCKRFGNIDNPNNSLYIKYAQVNPTSVTIPKTTYIRSIGTYSGMNLILSPSNGNTIKVDSAGKLSITWTLDSAASSCAEILDPTIGTINVKQFDATKSMYNINVKVDLINGTSLQATGTVGFFDKVPALGDLIFTDGTFASNNTESKTVVGVCYYANDTTHDYRVVSFYDIYSDRDQYQNYMGPKVDYGSTIYPYIDGNESMALFTSNYWNDSPVSSGPLSDLDGKGNTAKIIAVRNAKYGTDIPSVDATVDAVRTWLNNKQNADTACAYPSIAIAFQPDGVTADNLKRGNWYIAAMGELRLIVYYIYLAVYNNSGPFNTFKQYVAIGAATLTSTKNQARKVSSTQKSVSDMWKIESNSGSKDVYNILNLSKTSGYNGALLCAKL